MKWLSTVRRITFLIVLASAAFAPTPAINADEGSCEGYEWCGYCDAGSVCTIALNDQCSNYTGCRDRGFCAGTSGPTLKTCTCDPCA